MKPDDFVESARDQLALVARPASPDELQARQAQTSERPSHIWTFVPPPLPPELTYDGALVSAVGRAMLALGRIDHLVQDLPNPLILVRPFQRREAVASSRIEGTVAEVSDLVVFEATNVARDQSPEVREVENYRKALEYGLSEPQERSISLSLICGLHRVLLEGVRGSHLQPGELRIRLVRIGQKDELIENARYVPPPPWEIEPLMRDLERYIDSDSDITPLIRLALIHYQFEAIHPFSDGNGRVGRLLLALLLRKWGVMDHPIVDISAYVLRNRDEYIEGLLRVSQQADWRSWIDFFLRAVEEQAADALARSKRLLDLRERYLAFLAADMKNRNVEPLVDHLFEETTITARRASELLNVSFPTAQGLIQRMVSMGMLDEVTRQQRNRVYLAREIVAILDDLETDSENQMFGEQTIQVSCVSKPNASASHEEISHLGGSGWLWTRQQVINAIEAKTHRFFTSAGGRTAWVGVRQGPRGKYLQTYADSQWANNLLALPECR
jgi:Fic family protein